MDCGPPIIAMILGLASGLAYPQAVLFSEDFEGAPQGFTLNTTDVGSSVSGDNIWVVNNAYAGGTGSLTCFGFPFSYTIVNTPAQPAGISNANGHYLHIANTSAISLGIMNSNFAAADGFCINPAHHFAKMNTDVNTLGAGTVTLSFWWLCAGSGNNYGEVYYSTNSGASWALVSSPIATYHGQNAWVQQNISLPVFAGQATLRFGFRFVNNTTASAFDPAFSIDDVSISSDQPLPITLVDFNAHADDGQVRLDWTTASEQDNAWFTVERSAGTTEFQPVLRLPGAGNSSMMLHYSAVDEQPLNGVSYYRLRQTDVNGTNSVSSVVAVVISGDAGPFIVCPNPCASSVITLPPGSKGQMLEVFTSCGTPVFSTTLSSGTVKLPALPAGIYLLVLSGADGTSRHCRLVML